MRNTHTKQITNLYVLLLYRLKFIYLFYSMMTLLVVQFMFASE